MTARSHQLPITTLSSAPEARIELQDFFLNNRTMARSSIIDIEHPIVFGNTISEKEAMANVDIVLKRGELEQVSHL